MSRSLALSPASLVQGPDGWRPEVGGRVVVKGSGVGSVVSVGAYGGCIVELDRGGRVTCSAGFVRPAFWLYSGAHHYSVVAPSGETVVKLPVDCTSNGCPGGVSGLEVGALLDCLNLGLAGVL